MLQRSLSDRGIAGMEIVAKLRTRFRKVLNLNGLSEVNTVKILQKGTQRNRSLQVGTTSLTGMTRVVR